MTKETAAEEEEFTELRDAVIGRMDGVGETANGTRFLIAKSAAEAGRGLLDPEFVRELITKAQPATLPQETVTMTGSPAAIAAIIHNAPVRKHAAAGDDPVSKADDSAEDLDAGTVMAAGEGDAGGDPAEPGSPAWEAIDAATARKWTAILARACNALSAMADREMLEAVSADGNDAWSAVDLEGARCAIDYAISVLAPFAVGEQAEADLGSEALAAVGKALAGFDAAALDTVEALVPVAKAGRVLSAGNESAIRGAVDALQKVLASLPAPLDDSGQPVAKQTQETPVMTASTTSETAATEAAETTDVVKADAEAQVAVYTCDGVLFGTVAPDAVMPVVQAEAPEGAQPDGAGGADMAEDVAEAAEPEPTVEPGEDAEVIPGTSTVASPAADEDEIVKAAQAGFGPLLAEALMPFVEELKRTAGLADVVKGLQERVEFLAKMPDDRKSPLLNGATGTLPATDANDALAELRKAVADAETPAAAREAKQQLAYAEIRERFAGTR